MVPRAECQYRRQDFSNIPPRQRASVARLASKRYEPVVDSPAYVAWRAGVAHFWIWSPTAANARLPAGARWIPETVLLPAPVGNAERLLRLMRGYEGQVWREGDLVASQWWESVPDADAWQRFLRGAGLASSQLPPPAPEQFPWELVPWGRAQRIGVDNAQAYERLAWHVLLVVALCALAWEGASVYRWDVASRTMAAQLENHRLKAEPALAARDRAEAARDSIAGLTRLQNGIDDYVLMAEVASALPQGAQLASWRREPGKLHIGVKTDEQDPRVFVEAFSGLPQLASVTATPVSAKGQMMLDFSLPVPDGDDVDGTGPTGAP